MPTARSVALLAVEVTAVEVELYTEQVRRRIIPASARRLATAAEVASRARFADIDDAIERVAGLIHRRHTDALTGIGELIRRALGAPGTITETAAVFARYAAATGPTLPGLDDLVATLAAQAVIDAQALAAEAAAELVDEFDRQGARVPVVNVDVADVVAGPVYRAAAELPRRALGAAADHLARTDPTTPVTATVVDGAVAAAQAVSDVGAADLARQAANVAYSAGRTAQLRAHPPPDVAYYYASELLDRNTCTPCSHVDGREYRTLLEALSDYPGMGGHVDCQGGPRCRGTLVAVHEAEAEPTRRDARPAEPRDPAV